MKSASTKTGILLIVVAAVTLEASSLTQYFYSSSAFQKEASARAESQLEATRYEIMDVIDQAETAVRNSVWITRWCLNYTDSIASVCRRVVEDNPVVLGSTVALVPGYDRHHPLFAPYVHNQDSSLALVSLATPEYNYPAQEWFRKPVELDCGYWSEPYVDTGGGEVLMTTYSFPVKDEAGKTAAVLTADISLDWLIDLMGDIKVYPHARGLILSRNGQPMVSMDRTLIMNHTIMEVVDQIKDSDGYKELNRAMLAGESGNIVLSYMGEKSHIYYAPVGRPGWSMCIIIPEDDIYGGMRRTSMIVKLFQLIGLIMLFLIMRSFFKNQLKFKELDKRRERMMSELHVASSIQMSMVPDKFPERDDLDMAAAIIPAKEVGGDLYDFFIRDNKLFFCIGDVSGKGVPASLVMAVTRTTFRNLSAQEDSPGKIVRAMNDNLAAMNDNDMFVTFFCGVLDLEGGMLRYCNAGHNPPLTLTTVMELLPIEANLPLGVMGGMDYIEQEMQLQYDDALFLYTDGLTEAENLQHEQFGVQRMMDVMHGRKHASKHLDNISASVSQFVGEAPQSDDLTMFFIHYLGHKGRYILRLYNDIQQVVSLPGFLEEVFEASGKTVSPEVVSSVNLAIEEAVSNVMLYAYPEGTEGVLDLEAQIGENSITFLLSDCGKAFDPTAKAEVDISAGVEDRPIGGLGIHLVRTIMDSVSYERRDRKNFLLMTKNI